MYVVFLKYFNYIYTPQQPANLGRHAIWCKHVGENQASKTKPSTSKIYLWNQYCTAGYLFFCHVMLMNNNQPKQSFCWE